VSGGLGTRRPRRRPGPVAPGPDPPGPRLFHRVNSLPPRRFVAAGRPARLPGRDRDSHGPSRRELESVSAGTRTRRYDRPGGGGPPHQYDDSDSETAARPVLSSSYVTAQTARVPGRAWQMMKIVKGFLALATVTSMCGTTSTTTTSLHNLQQLQKSPSGSNLQKTAPAQVGFANVVIFPRICFTTCFELKNPLRFRVNYIFFDNDCRESKQFYC
jgi:hypothetical protein